LEEMKGDNISVDADDEGKTELFVKNLSKDTCDDDEPLRALFEPFGELVKCKILSFK